MTKSLKSEEVKKEKDKGPTKIFVKDRPKKKKTILGVKLKKGDNVLVISGKDKGKSGSILSIFPKKNRAIVKGVNVVKKHQKPSKQSGGGIIEKELSIHISNLTFLSLKDGKKTKIGYKFENNKKIRIEKKTGEIIRNV